MSLGLESNMDDDVWMLLFIFNMAGKMVLMVLVAQSIFGNMMTKYLETSFTVQQTYMIYSKTNGSERVYSHIQDKHI